MLQGSAVAIFSDNTMVLLYLLKQGRTHFLPLNTWAVTIMSLYRALPMCLLMPSATGLGPFPPNGHYTRKCATLWKLNGCPLMDQFATKLNCRIPVFISLQGSCGVSSGCVPVQLGSPTPLCLPSICGGQGSLQQTTNFGTRKGQPSSLPPSGFGRNGFRTFFN